MHLLRVLLRLDPELPHDRVLLAPALPAGFAEFSLRGMPLAGARVDVRARGGQVEVDGLPPGIALVRRARPPISKMVSTPNAGSTSP
jgi:hypothetical protein